jgi:uncharacterized protein (TIGR03382 family)
MKRCIPLITLAWAVTSGTSGAQTWVDEMNYPGLFGPDDDVTVVPPAPGILDLTLGGSASGALGDFWSADAQGGARLSALGVTLAQTGAQVALSDGALEFNLSNDPDSLLGALGVGTSLALSWSATALFDLPGNELLLAPNTTYRIVFDVDGSNGLLDSTLGITPAFGLEFLDGAGNAVDATGGGTLVNVIGLELLGVVGSPPESGRAVVDFQTGSSVAAGPAGVRFTGSALLPATALNLGTNFASVSGLQISTIPEPATLALAAMGLSCILRRRRG